MATSKISTIQTYYPQERQQDSQVPQYTLKWRQRQLLVLRQFGKQAYLPSIESEQWLVECLKHSTVKLIRIDPELGEASLKFWADACEQAKKPIFLRVLATHKLHKHSPLRWWLSRLISWSAAAILLVILSPIMLALVCLIRIQSPESILYRQWYVGERGKLFRLLKFRTKVVNSHLQKPKDDLCLTRLGLWMCKYSLDKLPQLFNVLRGEMSLIGPRPSTLYDAVQISSERQQWALPGIIFLKFPQPF